MQDKIWRANRIEAVKSSIKAELDTVESEKGYDGRLKHILKRIELLNEEDTPSGKLHRYVYVISALVTQIRYTKLPLSYLKELKEIAYAILLTEQIKPSTSKISYLYGEIHGAFSQILWKRGQIWRAAWEQLLCHLFVRKSSDPHERAFQEIALGNRFLRLGFASHALKFYRQATVESESFRELAYIGEVKCLRLNMAFDEVKIKIHQYLQSGNLSPAVQQEMLWEELCSEAMQNQNSRVLIEAVSKDASHYSSIYILEAFFWSMAGPRKNSHDDFPKLRTLLRKPSLRLTKLGQFYRSAMAFEQCLDVTTDFHQRVLAIGNILEKLNNLATIEHQLLVVAACVRWLARNGLELHARLSLCQYQAHSLTLSDGKSNDILGLLSDVLERSWAKA